MWTNWGLTGPMHPKCCLLQGRMLPDTEYGTLGVAVFVPQSRVVSGPGSVVARGLVLRRLAGDP